MRALALAVLFLSAASAGAESVRLSDFAKQHALTQTRDAIGGRDILRGGSTVIVAPGLATAIVDGTPIRLSEPARIESGRTLIAGADASRIAALLRAGGPPPPVEAVPSTARAPQPRVTSPTPKPAPGIPAGGRFRTIVLDPGHGGIHTGGKGARGTLEKEIALDVSRQIRDRLSAQGIRIVMTRETDRHLAAQVRDDLEARVRITEKTRPDLFLSIHVNWAENKEAQGFEVFYPRAGCEGTASQRQAGRKLAEAVRRIFAGRFDTPDRGVKEAGFYVIKNAPCAAVLVELEFVSNATGEKRLRDADYRKKLADAVVDAVLEEHRR